MLWELQPPLCRAAASCSLPPSKPCVWCPEPGEEGISVMIAHPELASPPCHCPASSQQPQSWGEWLQYNQEPVLPPCSLPAASPQCLCQPPVIPRTRGCSSQQSQQELSKHNTAADPRLWLWVGSMAGAGLAWVALEPEPSVAQHSDVFHTLCRQQLCFPPCATAGSTSLVVWGAGGTGARFLLAGICSSSQPPVPGQAVPWSCTGVRCDSRMFAISSGQKGPHGAPSAQRLSCGSGCQDIQRGRSENNRPLMFSFQKQVVASMGNFCDQQSWLIVSSS